MFRRKIRYIVTASLWLQGTYNGAMVLAHRPIFGQPDLEPLLIKGSPVRLKPVHPGEDIAEGWWLGRKIIVSLKYVEPMKRT